MEQRFWSIELSSSRPRALDQMNTKCKQSSLSAAGQLYASKPLLQVVYFFFTVPVTSLGPSPQSSTPCQQTFPCCTVCLVWLALGATKIPYGLRLQPAQQACLWTFAFLKWGWKKVPRTCSCIQGGVKAVQQNSKIKLFFPCGFPYRNGCSLCSWNL